MKNTAEIPDTMTVSNSFEFWDEHNDADDPSCPIYSRHIAHVRSSDQTLQPLVNHLLGVANTTKQLAAKINASEAGELIGLLHDLGKYSCTFQVYLRSATGLLVPDRDDDYVDAKALKGKIDHSSAGAQWIWQKLRRYGDRGRLCGQILAICLASHHSGLLDCLKPDGTNGFAARMGKAVDTTHLNECSGRMDDALLQRLSELDDKTVLQAILGQIKLLMTPQPHNASLTIQHFYLGFWTRFLFSCLIDADRMNSADFETPENARYRSTGSVQWEPAIERMESFLTRLAQQSTAQASPINDIRRDIADACRRRAADPQGIYTLTVPTGGGKTYASLRFALHHAHQHDLERIVYVIPYTSIIEQNAAAIRNVIEQAGDPFPWVLEHHSNLEPENQTWHSKLVAANWDAPIVLTTMVQFLEALFGSGTRGVRRLHQLARSVIIFDEIQTLPVNCTHLFCNALNFLTHYAGTTAVLCTATQPLLDRLRAPDKGQLWLTPASELMPNVKDIFDRLKRVDVRDQTRSDGWSEDDIAALALSELREKGNCLVIVNTKAWAQALYRNCAGAMDTDSLFHLSTSLCPAHRRELFQCIQKRLADKQPVLCISTQLIEAGVDIDFASVIRFLAGLDSIAQAAGRCNRHGNSATATVHIVNPAKEHIEQLIDIRIGLEKTQTVLGEIRDRDLLDPEVMACYFQYYFYGRSDDMGYPVAAKQAERDDSLLNLLSANEKNVGFNANLHLKQSFMTAARAFKAIDAPTHAIITPYQDGQHLITELGDSSAKFDKAHYRELLRRAQKYSVNVFPTVWKKLLDQQAVFEILPDEGIYGLDQQYYSDAFGVSTEPVGKAEAIIL